MFLSGAARVGMARGKCAFSLSISLFPCTAWYRSCSLAEAGYRVTAVDYTPAMLAEARKNAGSLASSIEFLEMNGEALTFPDGVFDVVVSRNLTWNLSHPEKAYQEWQRVLVPGELLLNFDATGTATSMTPKSVLPTNPAVKAPLRPGFRTGTPAQTSTPWRPLPGRYP